MTYAVFASRLRDPRGVLKTLLAARKAWLALLFLVVVAVQACVHMQGTNAGRPYEGWDEITLNNSANVMSGPTFDRGFRYGSMDNPAYGRDGEARQVGVWDLRTDALSVLRMPATCWHVAPHPTEDRFYALSFRVEPQDGEDCSAVHLRRSATSLVMRSASAPDTSLGWPVLRSM